MASLDNIHTGDYQARGDIVVGTDPNSKTTINIGTTGTILTADPTARSGASWAVSAALTARTAQTSGALATTSAWVSTTAKQIDAAQDRFLVVPITLTPTGAAAATCVVALSPDNSTFSTVVTETAPIGTALDSFVVGAYLFVPKGWYVKLTFTNATVAPGTYY